MTTPKKTATSSSPFIRKARSKFSEVAKRLGHISFGLFILVSMFVGAQHTTRYYGFNIPPAILGIAVLFITLVVFQCVPRSIFLAGKPLLAHMSLFFLPAIVAIANYVELLRAFPIALLLAIVITTLISLAITALFAQWLMQTLLPQSVQQNSVTSKNKDNV